MKRFQFISRLATSVAAVALTIGTAVGFSSCSDDDENLDTTPAIVRLATPANPAASVSGSEITASWEAVTGALNYTAEIRFSKYGDVIGEVITELTTVTFTDLVNSDYVFRVRANDANVEKKNSEWSAWIEGLKVAVDPQFMPLDTPKDPVCDENRTTATSLTFNWEVVENAADYTFKLSDETGEPVREATTDKLTATIENLESGKTYTFMVKANPAADTDCYRSSSYSKSVTGTTVGQLATPAAPEITLRMAEALSFRWTEVENAAGYAYELYEGQQTAEPIVKGSTLEPLAAGDIKAETTNSSVSFMGLKKDTYYSFRIKAVAAEGANFVESAFTDYVITKTLITDATPLVAPVVTVTATPISITAAWAPVTGAVSYKVQFGASIAEAEASEPEVIAADELGVLATELTKEKLSPATAYYVRVMACSDPEDTTKIDSEYSAWADATTAALVGEKTIDSSMAISEALLWMAEGGTLTLKGGEYVSDGTIYFDRGVRIVAAAGEKPVLKLADGNFNVRNGAEISTIELNGLTMYGKNDPNGGDHIFNISASACTVDAVKFIGCEAYDFARSFFRTQNTSVVNNVLIENSIISWVEGHTQSYDLVQLNQSCQTAVIRNSTFIHLPAFYRNNGKEGVVTVENCTFANTYAKGQLFRMGGTSATFKNCVLSGALAKGGNNATSAGFVTAENYFIASDMTIGTGFAVEPVQETLTGAELFPNAAAGNYAPAASSQAYAAKAGDPRWY